MDIERLKKLYKMNWLTIEKLDTLLADGKITQEQYDYIIL